MIGGFLGAGKTTAVAQFADHLHRKGVRVGLITNDQASNLVDTAMLQSRGFAVEEIAGGCFCCRFSSLTAAASKLTAATRPDVFIAEPVGSCTDLVATVTYPLRRIYGDQFSVAPLSVLVDPVRAARVLGIETGGNFSPKVIYIYQKQLEEADVLVINKTDLLRPDQIDALDRALQQRFPGKRIFHISARKLLGLQEWFAHVESTDQLGTRAMTVDYEVYAAGEALLGWLNATVRFASPEELDGNALLKSLAEAMRSRLGTREIAHLKMTLDPDFGLADLAVVNVVRNETVPELSQELNDPIQSGDIVVNVRAEADPAELKQTLEESLAALKAHYPEITLELDHCEFFRPGKPVPEHRIEAL